MTIRPNAYDVARAAGVSRTVISLVINGKADKYGIAKRTQERVRVAIHQTGYTPNMTIRDMFLKRRDLMAVTASDGSPGPASLAAAIAPTVASAGCRFEITRLAVGSPAAAAQVAALVDAGAAVLILPRVTQSQPVTQAPQPVTQAPLPVTTPAQTTVVAPPAAQVVAAPVPQATPTPAAPVVEEPPTTAPTPIPTAEPEPQPQPEPSVAEVPAMEPQTSPAPEPEPEAMFSPEEPVAAESSVPMVEDVPSQEASIEPEPAPAPEPASVAAVDIPEPTVLEVVPEQAPASEQAETLSPAPDVAAEIPTPEESNPASEADGGGRTTEEQTIDHRP